MYSIVRHVQRHVVAYLALLIGLSGSSYTAAITPGVARAAFPGTNGKIVFETNRDGNEEIYTMNSDGTNRVDLTRNPAEDTDRAGLQTARGLSSPATGAAITRSTR
jgi:hypothetical protein